MYVITGATGHTGNEVAEKLLAKGEQVRVVGRSAKRLEPFVKKGAEAFVADITDTGALACIDWSTSGVSRRKIANLQDAALLASVGGRTSAWLSRRNSGCTIVGQILPNSGFSHKNRASLPNVTY